MSLESEELRGRNAQDLLNNPILKEALDLFKKEVFEVWIRAKEPEEREDCWRMYNSALMFEGVLNGFIQSGKIAREQIKRLNNG